MDNVSIRGMEPVEKGGFNAVSRPTSLENFRNLLKIIVSNCRHRDKNRIENRRDSARNDAK